MTTAAPPVEKKWPPGVVVLVVLLISFSLWAPIAWGIQQLVHWSIN